MTFTPSIPGSRSITARALVCAALGQGTVVISGAAECDDAWAIADCLTTVGARLEGGSGHYAVEPARRLRGGVLNCRASGSTFRFMCGLAVLIDEPVTLTGTPRLLERPMGALVDVLRSFGKHVEVSTAGIAISGTASVPTEVTIDAGASGQFVSGLLLAAGALGRPTVVTALRPRSVPFIQMTVDVMAAYGQLVEVTPAGADLVLSVPGGGYTASAFEVEPDVMSANYLLAAALVGGRPVTVGGIPQETTQGDAAMIEVLTAMGAQVDWGTGGVTVAQQQPVRGVSADLRDMPDMSLTLAVLAALADGPSTFSGVANLRHKESDRLAVLENELTRIGCHVEISADDDRVRITPLSGPVPSVAIDTYDDHRVAMAFGLLTLLNDQLVINDPECVNKTWPGYFAELARYAAA